MSKRSMARSSFQRNLQLHKSGIHGRRGEERGPTEDQLRRKENERKKARKKRKDLRKRRKR